MSKTAVEILNEKTSFKQGISNKNYTCVGVPFTDAIKAMEEYASLRSKELQERVERMEKALHWAKEVFLKLGDQGKYPEFLLQENGGEGIIPIISALSGEATKEKDPVSKYVADYGELETKVAETLEAYNRECKRVDELTEEVESWKEKHDLAYKCAEMRGNTIELKRKRIDELEGLLKRSRSKIDEAALMFEDTNQQAIREEFSSLSKEINKSLSTLEETKKLSVKEN